MESRILLRFVGEKEDLSSVFDFFVEHFPEVELPSQDSGEWYSIDDLMNDEYECRFEELPETELFAMDGTLVASELPEEFFEELMERFERVYGVFKWSSFEVGIETGLSEAWGEFIPDFMDDGSDEANEISEAVLGF